MTEAGDSIIDYVAAAEKGGYLKGSKTDLEL